MDTDNPIRLRADWVRIVEAAQEQASSEQAWLETLVDAASDSLRFPLGIGMYIAEHDAQGATARIRASVIPAETPVRYEDSIRGGLQNEIARAFHYPPRRATTANEIISTLSKPSAEAIRGANRAMGAADSLGLVVHPRPGVVIVMFAGYKDRLRLGASARTALEQVSLHIESGYRLLDKEQIVHAELSPDGAVLHRTNTAPKTEALAQRTRGVEAARSQRDPTALDLWPTLISGQMSLVERGRGRSRRYLVVENAPASQPMRSLTLREIDVLSLAANGQSVKLIAYGLGLSPTAVSLALASCSAKLGVATRMELVRIAAMLARDPRARFEEISLTESERDVLALVKDGLSNKQIAEMRSRSIRTIANQVASLLRKTNSASRRALVANH